MLSSPWKFAIYEIFIIGLISTALINAWLFFRDISHGRQVELSQPLSDSMELKAIELLIPFYTPIYTTLYAGVVAWGSLWGEDSIKSSRALARKAYLYNSGAHGFYAQILLSVLLSFIILDSGIISIAILALCGVSWIWILYELHWTVPRKIFIANGYNGEWRFFWQKPKVNDSPWGKYMFSTFFGGGVLSAMIAFALYTLAVYLAKVLVVLHGVIN